MRIEIFVVTTKIAKLSDPSKAIAKILQCRADLVKLFGGLTEIIDFHGFWLNRGKIDEDFGALWLIYTQKAESVEDVRFKAILAELKTLTLQIEQAYAVNDDLRLI